MKKMMFLASMLAAGMMLFAGCEPVEKIEKPQGPDTENPGDEGEKPDDGGETELEVNTYRIDGTDVKAGSVFATTFSGYLVLYVTKQEGIGSFEQFSQMDEEPENMFFLVTPSLLGKEIDLLTEKGEFSIVSTLSDVQIGEGISPDINESIYDGKAKFEYDEATRKCRVSITLSIADESGHGIPFELLAEATMPEVEVNENIYSIDGNEKPLRASFYMFPDEENLYLYFSSSEVFSLEEMTEAAKDFVIAMMPYTFDDSGTISVDASKANFMYMDNFSGEMLEETVTVTTAEVSVGSLNPDSDMMEMPVKANLEFTLKAEGGEKSVKIVFDGNSISGDYYPPVEIVNQFIYNGETTAIGSAVLDKRTVPYTLWFHKTQGCEVVGEMEGGVTIRLPESCLDGEPAGFSVYPDELSVAYDTNTWSGANGDTGTVTASVVDGTLSVDVSFIENFELTYQGPVVIIEK